MSTPLSRTLHDVQQTTIERLGGVVAAFCCEGFGLNRTTELKRAQIEQRVKELEKLTKFKFSGRRVSGS